MGLQLSFDVLGPPRAHSETQDLSLGRRKPHLVLAVLLASSHQEASAARLLDEVWNRDPDRAGMDLLKNAVYQLNKRFDADFGVRPVHSNGGDGYLIDRETVSIDAVTFEDLVRRLEQNRFTADAASIHGWAVTAVGLWRGTTAFSGLDGSPVVDDYARVLAAKWLAAQKVRFETALQLDFQGGIIADLEALAREHPLDESLCSSLMMAQARTGRQTEALRLYDDFRQRLVDRSGVDPSPDLKQLYMRILQRHESVVWRPERAAAQPAGSGHRAIEDGALHDDVIQLTRRPFAGRDRVLRALRSAVDPLAEDSGIQVLIGIAGMGKSRLVAALAEEEAADGRTVLYGRCSPERSSALDPVADMLQASAGRDRARSVTLSSLSSTATVGLPDIDPAIELERRIQAAAEALIERCGKSSPLLIIEDTQWVDRSTLAVIDRITAEHSGVRVVLTGRAGAVHPEADDRTTLANWLVERRWVELELAPLDDDAVEQLVAAVLPERHRHRAPSVSELVQRQARGIPALVVEVVHVVEYEAAKRRPFSLAHIEAVAPRSLRSAVHRRLLRLSLQGREALKAAAVAGSSFQLDVLSKVVGIGEDDLAALLDECVGEALLTEPAGSLGHYSFAYELLREAVLAEVSKNRRARLHRDLALALDQLRGPLALRDQALHLLGALPLGDATEAVRVMSEAAERAVQRFDVDDAIGLLHKAVVASEDHEVSAELHCDVLTSLTSVQSWSGESVAAAATLEQAVEVARRAADPSRFAKAVLAPGPHHRVVFGTGSRLDLLREATDRLQGQQPSALSVSIEANLLAESLVPGRYEKVGVDPGELVARATAVGDPSAKLDALFAAHAAARATPDLAARADLSAEIIGIAESADNLPQQFCGGLTCQIHDLMSEGRFDAVQRTAERLNDLAERASMPRYRWRSMVVRSALLRVRGEFEPADALSSEAVMVGRNFDRLDADAVFGMQMHDSLRFAGASHALRSALEQAAAQSPVTVAQLLLAQALISEDELAEANAIWIANRGSVITHDPDELWLPTLVLAAELVTTGIDDPDARRQLQAQLEPFSGQWVPVGIPVATWGPIDGYLAALAGALGQGDAARSLVDAAAGQCERAGAPMWLLRMERLAAELAPL